MDASGLLSTFCKAIWRKKGKVPYRYKTPWVIMVCIWHLLQFLELRDTHTVMNYVHLSILLFFPWLFNFGTMLQCTATWLPELSWCLRDFVLNILNVLKFLWEFHSPSRSPKLEPKNQIPTYCLPSDALNRRSSYMQIVTGVCTKQVTWFHVI